MLYLDDVDLLRRDDRTAQFSRLLEAVAGHSGITILAGEQVWTSDGRGPSDLISVAFKKPDFGLRRKYWQTSLASQGIAIDDHDIDVLTGRFRLTPGQVDDAVSYARNRALWRAAAAQATRVESESIECPPARVNLADLFAAARAQCGQELAKIASKMEAKADVERYRAASGRVVPTSRIVRAGPFPAPGLRRMGVWRRSSRWARA